MLDTSASRHLHAATPYGFAVSTISLGGRLTWGHNGRLIGSRASIRYLPVTGFTVAVVTNQDVIGPDVFGTSLHQHRLRVAAAAGGPHPLPAVPDATASAGPSGGRTEPGRRAGPHPDPRSPGLPLPARLIRVGRRSR